MHQIHVFIEVVKVFPHAADLLHLPGTGAQFFRKQQLGFFNPLIPSSLKILK